LHGLLPATMPAACHQNCNTCLNVPAPKSYSAILPQFCFNFHTPQFYFEGLSFHFSALLCATCCFGGCQRAPGFAIALGRQAGSILLPVHWNRFVFRQSPAMSSTPKCSISSAHGCWGELRCISSSEQATGAGEA